jgi:DNA-binding CsgD family transcriptional regulator
VTVRLALECNQLNVAREAANAADQAAALAGGVPSGDAAALRCRGLIDNDADRLLAAVELARKSGRVLEHAGACEDAATVLGAMGDAASGRALLEEALERYEAIGASWYASRARGRLRALGGGRGARGSRHRASTGWDSLTKSERAVVELVAEGLTNREVGTRLFISPHTVNSHLRHSFQKLGVSTRAALAATAKDHAFK